MLSLVQLPIAFGYAVSGGALTFAWHVQQSLISSMMLVVGLFTVISWDATFPDRRDVMILAPLPVAPHSILIAKLAASGCVVALAIAALNVASGVVWPLLFAVRRGTLYAAVQTLAAYWLTMILASVFLYAAVLTVQGLSALLLPRRAFLRVSALLQLGAFVLFLSVYFLQPALTTTASIMAPQNRLLAAWSPTFWFFALFHQLSGTLPSSLYWLAHRAWSALALAFAGAIGSLLLSYLRTMRQTVQEPDLVPATSGSHRASERGDPFTSALLRFSLRALIRSRQHRVALAFYAALVFAIALSLLKSAIGTPWNAFGRRGFSNRQPADHDPYGGRLPWRLRASDFTYGQLDLTRHSSSLLKKLPGIHPPLAVAPGSDASMVALRTFGTCLPAMVTDHQSFNHPGLLRIIGG